MTTETHEGIVDVSPRCRRCDRKLGELLTRPLAGHLDAVQGEQRPRGARQR